MQKRYIQLVILLFMMAIFAGCVSVPASPSTMAVPQPSSEVTTQPVRPGAAGLSDPAFPQAGNGGYDAQHYLLDLAVDVEVNVLTATVTMRARAAQDLGDFFDAWLAEERMPAIPELGLSMAEPDPSTPD